MGRKFKFAKTELQYSGATAKPKYMYVEVLPEQEGELIYNGEEQFPTWKNLDPLKLLIEGEKSAVNAGEHFITVTPMGNFAWPDNTQTPRQIPYLIQRKKISAVPSQNGTLIYNGTPLTPSWKNYNPDQLDIGGTYQNQTGKGTYTATFAPNNNHCWSNGTYAAKEVTWQIGALELEKPVATQTTYTYTGGEITLIVNNFNATYMTAANNTATNVGARKAAYALKDKLNTCWKDGSTDNVSIDWSITALILTKPTANTYTLTYNGSAQEPQWQNFNATYIKKVGNAQTDAGSFSTTFELKDQTNTCWQGGSQADVSYSWKIEKLSIALPAQVGTLTYNGHAQRPNWNFDKKFVYATYIQQMDAGTYDATCSLNDKNNSQWSNGSTNDIVVKWKINPVLLADPYLSQTEFTYDFGVYYEPTIVNLNTDFIEVSGEPSATDPGTKVIKLTLKNGNAKWSDNSWQKTLDWKINKRVVTPPTIRQNTFKYDGNYHLPEFDGFDSKYMLVHNGQAQYAVGVYRVNIAIQHWNKAVWKDNENTSILAWEWYIVN